MSIFKQAALAAHWHAFIDFDRADRRTSAAACLLYYENCIGKLFWCVYERLRKVSP